MQTELSASMMCANYANLEREIELLEEGGIDTYHIDIMDGQFVPYFCMGITGMRRKAAFHMTALLRCFAMNWSISIRK